MRVNGVVRLLTDLRRRDEQQLAALVVERRVPLRPTGSLIDLAETLLAPARLRDDLAALGWRELHRLRQGHPDALERARRRGFAISATDGGAPRTALLDEAAAALATLVGDGASADAADVDESASARAGERALAVAALAADVLHRFDEQGAAVRTGRSGPVLGGNDLRRLAVDLGEPVELVQDLAGWLVRGALIATADELWRPTDAGRTFLTAATANRWRALADAWLDGLTVDDRDRLVAGAVDAGDPLAMVAEAIGVRSAGRLTTAGAAALDDHLDEATDRIRPALPDEVAGVYIQPDLSIIAPGPLPAELDDRLRQVADLETRALASVYRLSPGSIARGLSTGLTVDRIRESLAGLALTPLPQPVEYLLDDAERTHGLIRVRALDVDATGRGGTRVGSIDRDLVDRLAVDQRLAPIGLRHAAAGTLVTGVSVEVVYWALVEARYPVAIEDEAGRERPALQRVTAPAPTRDVPPAALRLARALLEDSSNMAEDESLTWLQRRLELARRAKTVVRVRVTVPGADPVTLDLLPTSVGAHRLRARDDAADVERTLPLNAIELLDDVTPSDDASAD